MDDPIVTLLDGTKMPKSQVPVDTIYINENGQKVKKVMHAAPSDEKPVQEEKKSLFSRLKLGKKNTEEDSSSDEADEEKGTKMLKVMDWAMEKAAGNIPGFGNIEQTTEKYLTKHKGNVEDAVNEMIRWQMTTAATTGFVSSLGGLPTMAITLPANVAGVMAVQLRMIGGIARMGGCSYTDEDTKTGMYLCLLGAEGGSILAKASGQFAVKFATASLKKLPGAVLIKINKAVGFRLFTKFGTKGVINIGKAIPFLGGIVGGSVDAITTYGIANAAKALFLKSSIESERQEKMEVARMRILMNMAMVDGVYSDDEKAALSTMISTLGISDKNKNMLLAEAASPLKKEVDLKPFKNEEMYSACLISSLWEVANADGKVSPAERIYLNSIGKDLGYTAEELKSFLI